MPTIDFVCICPAEFVGVPHAIISRGPCVDARTLANLWEVEELRESCLRRMGDGVHGANSCGLIEWIHRNGSNAHVPQPNRSMILLTLGALSVLFFSSLIVLLTAKRAQVGYQDADGFHAGIQPAPLAEEMRFPVDAMRSPRAVRVKAIVPTAKRELSLMA